MSQRGLLKERRNRQNLAWMHDEIRAMVVERLYKREAFKQQLKELELRVEEGAISPQHAVNQLLASME